MDITSYEGLLETGVFELPGEPAIIINGLPPLDSSDPKLFTCAALDSLPQRLTGFGEWLEGRKVKKLFGELIFYGKVTRFDEETGWYRVEYEDCDFEDLEWRELEEILEPLDVNIPLKTLAMKIIKKKQKAVQKSGKGKVGNRKHVDYTGKGKEKERDTAEEG